MGYYAGIKHAQKEANRPIPVKGKKNLRSDRMQLSDMSGKTTDSVTLPKMKSNQEISHLVKSFSRNHKLPKSLKAQFKQH